MKTIYITFNNIGLILMLVSAYNELDLHHSDRTLTLWGILVFVVTRMLLSKKYY